MERYEIKNEIEPILGFVNKTILTEMATHQIYSKSTIIKWNINDNEVQELAKKLAKENPTRSENESLKWDIYTIGIAEFLKQINLVLQ